MATGYHATTPAKLAKYEASRAILPPVRWWSTEGAARRWMKRVTGRTVLLAIETPQMTFPLPVRGGAMWTPEYVRTWKEM